MGGAFRAVGNLAKGLVKTAAPFLEKALSFNPVAGALFRVGMGILNGDKNPLKSLIGEATKFLPGGLSSIAGKVAGGLFGGSSNKIFESESGLNLAGGLFNALSGKSSKSSRSGITDIAKALLNTPKEPTEQARKNAAEVMANRLAHLSLLA